MAFSLLHPLPFGTLTVGLPGRVFRCPLWVISGHIVNFRQCPLYPQKRTSLSVIRDAALCQKPTSGVGRRMIGNGSLEAQLSGQAQFDLLFAEPSQELSVISHALRRVGPAVARQLESALSLDACSVSATAQPKPGVCTAGSIATATHLLSNVATTSHRTLDINDPLSWHNFRERVFASSVVPRLVEYPIEMPRFATSSGFPTAMAPAATLEPVSPRVAARAIPTRVSLFAICLSITAAPFTSTLVSLPSGQRLSAPILIP
jgi:hypothetical protein